MRVPPMLDPVTETEMSTKVSVSVLTKPQWLHLLLEVLLQLQLQLHTV